MLPQYTGIHPKDDAPGPPFSILVIDDDRACLDEIQEFLTARSLKVLTAGSVEEAVRLFAGNSFEILLIDLEMPQVSGLGLAKQLLGGGFEERTVLMTGHYEKAQLAVGQTGSGLHILLKPLKFRELLETLSQMARAAART